MATRAAQLAVELTERGASDVAGGLDKVTSAASHMGDTVEEAGRKSDMAGNRMDSAAEGADEMASKGSQAAGAMGGLGELIGGPFGAAMQTGGIGLQAMADSGDLLNAAMENSVVSSLRAKGATVAKTVADKASAAATRATTIAQKALNLAQRASPIGLIITGVLLLVGGLILAYKHSARFRAIVDAAMRVARAGVDKVVSGFQLLGSAVGKVMAFIGRVVGVYVRGYIAAFRLGFTAAQSAWHGIQTAVSTVLDFITRRVDTVKDRLTGAWDTVRAKGKAAFDALLAPLQAIIALVERVVDKVSNIHLPSLPHIPGLGRTASTVPVAGALAGGGDTTSVSVVVNPAAGTTPAQAQATAQATMDAIDNRLTAIGRKPVFRRG